MKSQRASWVAFALAGWLSACKASSNETPDKRSLMLTKTVLIDLISLVIAGCTASVPTGSVNPAVQNDLRTQSDQAVISSYPALIVRDGASLKIAGQVFTDKGDCQAGDCTRYRVDGVWHDRFVGIDVSQYEDSDYILIDAKGNGSFLTIGSRPIPSPSGRLFFAGHHDDREWSPFHGASVWLWEPFPRRLRVVDTDLVVFDSFVAWRGDRCVEFKAARGFNVGMQPVRTFWLTEQEGDWRLLEKRPNDCRPEERKSGIDARTGPAG
jgi:hypothetical protein